MLRVFHRTETESGIDTNIVYDIARKRDDDLALTYLVPDASTKACKDDKNATEIEYFDVYTWMDASVRELKELFMTALPGNEYLEDEKKFKIYQVYMVDNKVKKKE